MSVSANIAKVTLGAALLTAACGVFSYEALLNIKLATKIGERFFAAKEEAASACREAIGELTEKERVQKSYSEKWNGWLREQRPVEVKVRGKTGEIRHALIYKNEKRTDKWVVLLHGYTSSPEGMSEFAYIYNAMGFNCALPSMIGHGKDPHARASMGWLDRYAVLDLIDYILLLSPEAEIVIHGVSMGGACTMLTTGEKLPSNVKAAVSDCGYTSVYDEYKYIAGQRKLNFLLPLIKVTSVLSKLSGNLSFEECSPLKAVGRSVTPTLFIHGEDDEFVPFSMLDKLYEGCAAEKEKISVKGAAHAESSSTDPKYYWKSVYDFLEKKISKWQI